MSIAWARFMMSAALIAVVVMLLGAVALSYRAACLLDQIDGDLDAINLSLDSIDRDLDEIDANARAFSETLDSINGTMERAAGVDR